MNITKNGVELNADEFQKFFEERAGLESMVYTIHNIVVGDIVAISPDRRLVLDVDNGTGVELYSDTYNMIVITITDLGYNVSILK